jgi:hypothetical protein
MLRLVASVLVAGLPLGLQARAEEPNAPATPNPFTLAAGVGLGWGTMSVGDR